MSRTPFDFAKSSMRALLGEPTPKATEHSVVFRTENIRQLMLDSMGDGGWAEFAYLERRILFAPDAEDLWYLRSDLMHAVASIRGEAIASHRLQEISGMFKGLLPDGLGSRPSPLSP